MRRKDLKMFCVVLGGLILAGVGLVTGVKPFVGAGTLLAGLMAVIGMVRTEREGVIRTNWGTMRRAEDPIGFRIEATFWWIVILAWTSGGVLHGLGILVR
jgi:hypothetical protein